MPPGGIVGEVSATESWSARQRGWTNILAELPRMPRGRTFENPLGELRRITLPQTWVNRPLIEAHLCASGYHSARQAESFLAKEGQCQRQLSAWSLAGSN